MKIIAYLFATFLLLPVFALILLIPFVNVVFMRGLLEVLDEE